MKGKPIKNHRKIMGRSDVITKTMGMLTTHHGETGQVTKHHRETINRSITHTNRDYRLEIILGFIKYMGS